MRHTIYAVAVAVLLTACGGSSTAAPEPTTTAPTTTTTTVPVTTSTRAALPVDVAAVDNAAYWVAAGAVSLKLAEYDEAIQAFTDAFMEIATGVDGVPETVTVALGTALLELVDGIEEGRHCVVFTPATCPAHDAVMRATADTGAAGAALLDYASPSARAEISEAMARL